MEGLDSIRGKGYQLGIGMHQFAAFVYFISDNNGRIKIGKAKNPRARLKTLQTSTPAKLEILGVIPGSNTLEGMIHFIFKDRRLSGEWFSECPELIEFIAREAVAFSDVLLRESEDKLESIMRRDNPRPNVGNGVEAHHLYALHKHLCENIVRGIDREAGEHFETALTQMFVACRSLRRLMDEIARWSAKNNVAIFGASATNLEIRRAVDEILQIKWQEADWLLNAEEVNYDYIKERSKRLLKAHVVSRLSDQGTYDFCTKLLEAEQHG